MSGTTGGLDDRPAAAVPGGTGMEGIGMGSPAQLEIVSAVFRELERQGFASLNARQMNAVIEAANLIVREVGEPHRTAGPGAGLAAWLASDDTGLSSVAMAYALWDDCPTFPGRRPSEPDAHPLDPADFGRCVRMLEAAPHLRSRMDRAANLSAVWGRLVSAWGELEALYRKELPSGKAPRLYARMRELIDN